MAYQVRLFGGARQQFRDIVRRPEVYEPLMVRIVQLTQDPFDQTWRASEDDPEYWHAEFGRHGLLSFWLDDTNDMIAIYDIVWTG